MDPKGVLFRGKMLESDNWVEGYYLYDEYQDRHVIAVNERVDEDSDLALFYYFVEEDSVERVEVD